MNNQQDPAVEAALERAQKLINRDPQLRRKYWIQLIVCSCLAAPVILAFFLPYELRDNTWNFITEKISVSPIAYSIGMKVAMPLYLLVTCIHLRCTKTITIKLMEAVLWEKRKIDPEIIESSESLSKIDLIRLKKIGRNIFLFKAGINLGLLSSIFIVWMGYRMLEKTLTLFNGCHISVDHGIIKHSEQGMVIYSFLLGGVVLCIFMYSVQKLTDSIGTLFQPDKFTCYEQLLMKLRKIKAGE